MNSWTAPVHLHTQPHSISPYTLIEERAPEVGVVEGKSGWPISHYVCHQKPLSLHGDIPPNALQWRTLQIKICPYRAASLKCGENLAHE